eukprot:8013647-Alexandrium_andersonii.AAC.1
MFPTAQESCQHSGRTSNRRELRKPSVQRERLPSESPRSVPELSFIRSALPKVWANHQAACAQ